MSDPAEEQVAWMATPYRAKVLDVDGQVIGTAESLLGDESEDIFHGLAVKPAAQRGHSHELVEIEAAAIVRITNKNVYTSLSGAEVAALPAYHEEKWFHLGWGGLFRKHPEWKSG